LADEVHGMPESRVFETVAKRWYGLRSGPIRAGDLMATKDSSEGDKDVANLSILVEDESTNCGANALKTKEMLDAAGITAPRSIIVVQDLDPTMSRRTVASFNKAYLRGQEMDVDETVPKVVAWPTLVPEV
ncbi:hypothetical protein BGZ61DRAFT_317703, partial [Ilyonectria robusta]|uniref:uncharacterized protein n=1 Tax=Ilyonectria robusta TaxID=1079257 RepID=UPI001E8D3E7E